VSDLILAARGLEYAYPDGVGALQGLDLEIRRGRKLALLGANGSGKTTLLLHLNGTLRPARGLVSIEGQPATYDRNARKRWRDRVGLVLQDPDDQLFSASVYQDVSFGPLNQGLSEAETQARVETALAQLRIAHLADRATHALSFGQKKRVAIAGVLAMQPDILILDEPTAGLDPHGVAHLLAALQNLLDTGTTLVFSTHDVDLAYAWADEAAILNRGSVERQGDVTDIFADAELLNDAHLRQPTVLALAMALRGADGNWPGNRPPRNQAELLAMLRPADTEPEPGGTVNAHGRKSAAEASGADGK
jgi:cobalt/nickel transport system ATP-binding protein